MKLQRHGKNISKLEVLAVSQHGIWLHIAGKEYFLPYQYYPWFKNVKLSEIYNIKYVHGTHLYWPDLDVDLELESLENPERYPLLYK